MELRYLFSYTVLNINYKANLYFIIKCSLLTYEHFLFLFAKITCNSEDFYKTEKECVFPKSIIYFTKTLTISLVKCKLIKITYLLPI